MLLAPTGVAADNIGGRTYQQLLPVDSDNKGTDIRPKKGGERYKRLVRDWKGVTHLILDEMSMLGRKCLGQVDDLLRCATGRETEDFGGVNIIFVGVCLKRAVTPSKQCCLRWSDHSGACEC